MSWYVVHGFYFLCLLWFLCIFFFFKQKTAYEMRISDWSSDVCSSDLLGVAELGEHVEPKPDASLLLQRAMQKLGLSARGYHRILKIARTIADLARNETVETSHVAEALRYRDIAAHAERRIKRSEKRRGGKRWSVRGVIGGGGNN